MKGESLVEEYLKKIEHELQLGNTTEHSHRPHLKSLIESLGETVTAINEPKRVKCGAPDYIVLKEQTPLGYIEAKDIGISLSKEENSEQMGRYRSSLTNLMLTDYVEFRWYVNGEHRLTARIAETSPNKIKADSEGIKAFLEMVVSFLTVQVPTVSSPKELAQRMAALARLIRDTIQKALEDEDKGGGLREQMEGFREVLLHDLTEEQFADMYAQTICYGLFAARCNTDSSAKFSREHAAWELPKTNPFLRKMFTHIAGPDLDDRVVWIVDDLAELLCHSDMDSILKDFGKRTRQEDPVVHFYETFLSAYDPQLREMRGVYYTPEPVVSFIVRSIDQILRKDFGLQDGLADSSMISVNTPSGNREFHKVQILDPACGTGTFLHSVIDEIYESYRGNEGMWSGYVSEHLLPRLSGFELLMAPYAVAHMKLGLQLQDHGYDFSTDERLKVYLTNTLEEAKNTSSKLPFAQWIADEANASGKVKVDVPVMVVLGNPPYANFGMLNKGDWITGLMEDYKKDLFERKWNPDDYMKFFRFAQWRIDYTGTGILAFISNKSYLYGITHRRMRQSLMESFDEIYILDLHGSSVGEDTSLDGSKDENVFDIRRGVAVGILVKKENNENLAKIYHADLWGTRDEKYKWLSESDISTTEWNELEDVDRETCLGKFFFFTPRSFEHVNEYCETWNIKDIFPLSQNGIKTDRDGLFLDFERQSLESRIKTFYSDSGLEADFRAKYRVTDSSSYNLLTKRNNTEFNSQNIHICLYRPFDFRMIYYAPGITSRPAWTVTRHMLQPNKAMILARIVARDDPFDAVIVSRRMAEIKVGDSTRSSSLFPMYIYPEAPETQYSRSMLIKNLRDDVTGSGRVAAKDVHDKWNRIEQLTKRIFQQEYYPKFPNLNPEFIAEIEDNLDLSFLSDGAGDLKTAFGPEDVFHYIYAILHSPTYRDRYAEFLKIDFPRIPLTSNPELFEGLCSAGKELVDLHLMEKEGPKLVTYPQEGGHLVDNVRYTEPGQGDNEGRVWINETQFFRGVPPEVWDFHIGGYQVCQKWLKDRKNRNLSFDDLEHYQKIVSALSETIRLMTEIDSVIEEHGGFPIQ